jgi:hypothetical protein
MRSAALATALAGAWAQRAAGDSASSIQFTAPKALLDAKGAPHVIDASHHKSALFGASDFGRNNQLSLQVAVDRQARDSTLLCPGAASALAKDSLLLVDGYADCSFVMEAQVAQTRGAKALLVMENKCLALDVAANSLKNAAWGDHCKEVGMISEINYMGGVDATIRIPSMIISRWEGMRLYECYMQATGAALDKPLTDAQCKAGEKPVVQMRWNIPQLKKVAFDLWTSSMLNADLFVKDTWAAVIMPKLIDLTEFQPRYFVWDGNRTGCTGAERSKSCEEGCHNKYLYCHDNPYDISKMNGRDISQENLRQYCAFMSNSDRAGQLKWWKYVALVAEKCTGRNASTTWDDKRYYTEDCSKEMHKQAGLDYTATTDKCIANGGGYGVNDGVNKDWAKMLNFRSQLEIERLPTLIVNGKVVDFGSSLQNVLSALCSGFDASVRPDWCACIENDITSEQAMVDACFRGITPTMPPPVVIESGIGIGMVLLIVVLVCAALVAAFMVVRQRDRHRMRSEFHEDVRNIMGEYMRMDQEEEDRANRPATRGSFLGFSRSGQGRANDSGNMQIELE